MRRWPEDLLTQIWVGSYAVLPIIGCAPCKCLLAYNLILLHLPFLSFHHFFLYVSGGTEQRAEYVLEDLGEDD